jgi:chemotaxis protein CheY-P-specific phosphatase CheC
MLNNFKEKEMEVATRLIFEGLSMAKSSMEQILQSPIKLNKVEYGNSKVSSLFSSKGGGKIHVIKTELKGELKGTSFLIFSEDEVGKIYRACLPEKVVLDDSPESKMMKMGFLTEIDNMVAAAVITEFANFLDMEIYGQVPTLQVVNDSEVNEFLSAASAEYDKIVHFNANFHGAELDISPDFIWMFQEKFADKIKELV